jgi:hypothetical protein
MSKKREGYVRNLILFGFFAVAAFGLGYLIVSNLPADKDLEVKKFWAAALQGLALVLGTVAIVGFVWQFLGGDPVDQALSDLGEVSNTTKTAVDDLKDNTKTLGGTLQQMSAVSTDTQAAVRALDGSVGALKTAQEEIIKSVALLADSRKTGVERIHAYSNYFATGEGWMRRLLSAQRYVDLMGYSLFVWTKGVDFENQLAQRVRSGADIRVLIMDADNEQLNAVLNRQIPGAILKQTQVEILGMTRSMKYVAD